MMTLAVILAAAIGSFLGGVAFGVWDDWRWRR